MAAEYTVKVAPSARAQIAGLVQYIAQALLAPGTAADTLDLLEKEIGSLSLFPHRYGLTEEEPWRGKGIHKMPVKNYIVYYLIDDAERTVDVTAVVNGRRDQLQQLSRMEIE